MGSSNVYEDCAYADRCYVPRMPRAIVQCIVLQLEDPLASTVWLRQSCWKEGYNQIEARLANPSTAHGDLPLIYRRKGILQLRLGDAG